MINTMAPGKTKVDRRICFVLFRKHNVTLPSLYMQRLSLAREIWGDAGACQTLPLSFVLFLLPNYHWIDRHGAAVIHQVLHAFYVTIVCSFRGQAQLYCILLLALFSWTPPLDGTNVCTCCSPSAVLPPYYVLST